MSRLLDSFSLELLRKHIDQSVALDGYSVRSVHVLRCERCGEEHEIAATDHHSLSWCSDHEKSCAGARENRFMDAVDRLCEALTKRGTP